MGHLDYYRFQAKARGVNSLEDVRRITKEKAYVYDRIVLPWLPEDKASPITELACGHGSFLGWLKSRDFSRVNGVDSSAEQIAIARQVGATVHQADVNQWLAGQSDASQQVIVGIDLIEHLSKDDFMALLEHSFRVLSLKGRLILRFPNGDSPLVGMNLFNDITHVWTYTPNCMNTLAQMHGFAGTEFKDESCEAIRDSRWLKVPLARLSAALLRGLLHAATRERVAFLSPHLWACLTKG